MKEILNIELEQQALSLITNITYGNVLGWFGAARKDLKMDLIVPKTLNDHAPCPCVIWICGGAFMTVDRSVWIPELMPFAKAGFVVASVEYRTSNEAQFPAPLIDIKSAVRFLKAHADNYRIDPNNIFIMGESAGGTLACLAGVTMGNKNFEQGDYLDFDSDVKGVVDFYGLTDITRSARKNNPPVPFWAMDAFIGENFTPEQAASASAVNYISASSPPFMILHGTNDNLVPISQSQSLYDKLQEFGIYSDFLVIQGASHGDDLFYQNVVLNKVIQFINKFLSNP